MELKIKLLVEKDINEYVYHWSESYSGLKIDTKDKITEKCNLFKSLFKTKFGTQWYSVKKQGKIIGGFRVFDQWINVHKKEVKVQAVGHIFVSLDERRKGVSKVIMEYIHKKALEDKMSLTILHPFKSQFYKNFGYGQGPSLFSYLIKPEQLKDNDLRRNVTRSFSAKNILSFYDKVYKKQHGLSKRTEESFKNFLNEMKKKVFIYKEKRETKGYIILEILPASEKNFLKNSIIVNEFLYLDSNALKGMLGFLRSLSDQASNIFLSVFNPRFYLNIINPELEENSIVYPVYQVSHKVSLGIMYRINDIPKFIEDLDEALFGLGNLSLKFIILDDLFHHVVNQVSISFSNGKATLKKSDNVDDSIEISLSYFSALFMGSVSFRDLYEFGSIKMKKISLINEIERIFSTLIPPQNLDLF